MYTSSQKDVSSNIGAYLVGLHVGLLTTLVKTLRLIAILLLTAPRDTDVSMFRCRLMGWMGRYARGTDEYMIWPGVNL